MKKYEPDKKLLIFCSDTQGYEKCGELGFEYYENIEIPDLNVSHILKDSDGTTSDYTKLSFVKTVIMRHILDLGYTPLYLDPDMALKRPCIPDLLSNLKDHDFVCAGSYSWLNSNIMIAKPTPFNLELFEVTSDDISNIVEDPHLYGDEDLLRPRLKNNTDKYKCVDIKKYPNGNDALKYINHACIIHANCVIGLDNKIKLLKQCDAWDC